MQGLFFIRIRKEFYMRALTMSGYAAPKGITNVEELKRLQKTIGVAPDGIWGAASQKAYDSYLKRFSEPLTSQYQVGGYSAPGIVRNRSDVKVMQEVLGNVAVDGIWGPETDAAYRQRLALDNAPQGGSANAASRLVSALADTRPVLDSGIPVPVKALSGGLSGQSVSHPIPRPVVDNAVGQQYTQSVTVPNPQSYSSTVLPTLNRLATDAASRPTVRPEAQANLGKNIIADLTAASPIGAEYGTGLHMPHPSLSERPFTDNASGTGGKPQPSTIVPLSSYDKDITVRLASSLLNLTTAEENKEACCNLYSATINGEKVYFIGEVFIGNKFDVVVPLFTNALWEMQHVLAGELYDLEDIQYEGFMHSHPYNDYSNSFSGGLGDALVALILESIFLTTPGGNIFELTRPKDVLNQIFSTAGRLMTSVLTKAPINISDIINIFDSLNAFSDWFTNPPEVPYNDLQSIDTTGISAYNTDDIVHDNKSMIQQILERYIESFNQTYDEAGVKIKWPR